MTEVLKADRLYGQLVEDIKGKIQSNSLKPAISIIRFGENPADISYEKGVKKTSALLGIEVEVNVFSRDEKIDKVIELIKKINDDDRIGGLLIFRPLPDHLDADLIDRTIDPKKDIDCMSPVNKSKIFSGEVNGFIPLAAKASVILLEHYGYEISRKKCVVINRTNTVGRPLVMLLLNRDATVTLCHSKTEDLKVFTKEADIVFTGMGNPEMLDSSYFKENSICIDIGVGKRKDGKIVGDLKVEDVEGKIRAYSPVPGGVGKLTNLLLLENVVNYYL